MGCDILKFKLELFQCVMPLYPSMITMVMFGCASWGKGNIMMTLSIKHIIFYQSQDDIATLSCKIFVCSFQIHLLYGHKQQIPNLSTILICIVCNSTHQENPLKHFPELIVLELFPSYRKFRPKVYQKCCRLHVNGHYIIMQMY